MTLWSGQSYLITNKWRKYVSVAAAEYIIEWHPIPSLTSSPHLPTSFRKLPTNDR